jgi:aminoglycoside phosphotransferase (APT) family kinase protein
VNGLVERLIGAPAVFEELKHKPGRRLTVRARGPAGSVIVKLYRSDRVTAVAGRISALADGPAETEVPRLLAVDRAQRLLVLSDLRGRPLREAVLASDEEACRRAGTAIAAWHSAWAGTRPGALQEHTIERELAVLADRAARTSRSTGVHVAAAAAEVRDGWTPATVVHRDLYESQVLLGERVGLIDLDDAALGPPELDVGNLLAHLDLLALRSKRRLDRAEKALLDGYAMRGSLDLALLERCRMLSRLRLACIHEEPRLLPSADSASATTVSR